MNSEDSTVISGCFTLLFFLILAVVLVFFLLSLFLGQIIAAIFSAAILFAGLVGIWFVPYS